MQECMCLLKSMHVLLLFQVLNFFERPCEQQESSHTPRAHASIRSMQASQKHVDAPISLHRKGHGPIFSHLLHYSARHVSCVAMECLQWTSREHTGGSRAQGSKGTINIVPFSFQVSIFVWFLCLFFVFVYFLFFSPIPFPSKILPLLQISSMHLQLKSI